MTARLKRIPQTRLNDDGGRVPTKVRLKPNIWRKVQHLADAQRISASRLLTEMIERQVDDGPQ